MITNERVRSSIYIKILVYENQPDNGNCGRYGADDLCTIHSIVIWEMYELDVSQWDKRSYHTVLGTQMNRGNLSVNFRDYFEYLNLV